MQCEICGKLCASLAGLAKHVRQQHLDINEQEYYDKYLKTQNSGYCEFCHAPTKFISLTKGYAKACNHSCAKHSADARYKLRTGFDNPASNPEVQNKRKATCIKNYGVKHFNNIEKANATCINKYGMTLSEKAKLTKIAKYGSVNNIEKIKATNLQNFGVEYSFQRKDVQEKIKSANLTKYGVEIASCNDAIKHKISEANKHYYDTAEKRDIQFGKMSNTYKQKYNYNWTSENPEWIASHRSNYMYNNIIFDSAPELYYYIWALDHNLNITRATKCFTFIYDCVEHKYFPDFIVNNNTCVELKGQHFFENGKMINPYDRSQDDLYEAKHQCMLRNHVKIITDYSEYENYVNEKYTKDFVNLFRIDLQFPYLNTDLHDKSDMGLIHHFHKSIYEAHKKNKPCPVEAWKDKEIIRKVALNRLKYVKKCKPCDILQGMTVTQIAPKISVFKPSLAQRLINTYLSDYSNIFDPFSGFSGRMLGAIAAGKNYIGQDIHPMHVEESNAILQFKKNTTCNVTQQDILTDIPKKFDTLFTCPPYGGKEHWNKDNDEVEKTCDEWIDLCLKTYICQRYVFVVDKTEKYKDFIVETLENTSHFGTNYEYVIVIDSKDTSQFI